MKNLINNVSLNSKPLAVVTSDWHVALNAWKKFPSIKGDAEYSLTQIVDMAIGLNVPLIAAGDLFDIKNPDSYSIHVVSNQMARMYEKGLPVYYVQGQHEMSDPTWLSLFKGCENVHNKHFKIKGVDFFGYDYFLPKSVEDSYNRFKPADVLVTHQVWSELLPHTGQEFCCSYSLVEHNLKYKALISGDFHSHFVSDVNDMKFVSPGSICLQDLKESCNKAAWIMTEDLGFVSAPYKTRRLIQSVINSESDLHTMVKVAEKVESDDMPNDIGRPIFRLRYSTKLDNVNAAITSAFKDKAHVDLVPIIEEIVDLPSVASDLDKLVGSFDINSSFHESLKDFCDVTERSYSDLIKLWSSRSVEDLRGELDNMLSDIKSGGT
jgi:hypothetical protein